MAGYNILMLMNKIDTPERYNYRPNFGMIEAVAGMENINLIRYDIETVAQTGKALLYELFDKYEIDIVATPFRKRWGEALELPATIKSTGIPLIIFDNDSYAFDFRDDFYAPFDWVFYRDHDKNNDSPQKGSFVPWSVDHKVFSPDFGGKGVVLCGSFYKFYPMRIKIREKLHPHTVDCTQYTGDDYVRHLQKSLMAISTSSTRFNFTASKLLEIAACGTGILTEDTTRLEIYFDKELLYIYQDIEDLKYYVNYAEANLQEIIERQKKLRAVVEEKHTNEIRAQEVLKVIEKEVLSRPF
jgi:hypothetical protein